MHETLKKENTIVRLSFELAVATVDFCEVLNQAKKWSLSDQIIRAALSIGANVKEAQNAESKKRFYTQIENSGERSRGTGILF